MIATILLTYYGCFRLHLQDEDFFHTINSQVSCISHNAIFFVAWAFFSVFFLGFIKNDLVKDLIDMINI